MQINGWDAVFGIRTTLVNERSTQFWQEDKANFSYNGTDPLLGNYQSSGALGVWTIVSGGSYNFLHVQIPILSGTISTTTTKVDLTNTVAIVQIPLSIIPATNNQSTLNFTLCASSSTQTTDSVNIISLTGNDEVTSDSTIYALLSEILANCLSNCSSQYISFIFSTINYNISETMPWLTPVLCDYGYDDGYGYLYILSVCSQKDISSLPRTVDVSFVTQYQEDTFCVMSNEMYMMNVITPIFPGAFGGECSVQDFQYNTNNSTVTNKTSFQIQNVNGYYPTINQFVASSQENQITVNVSGVCPLSGIDKMEFSITSRNQLQYNEVSNQLSFIADPDPIVSTEDDTPLWLKVISLDTVSLIDDIIINNIADALEAEATLNMTQYPPDSVLWLNLPQFKVDKAGLSDSFYLVGALG